MFLYLKNHFRIFPFHITHLHKLSNVFKIPKFILQNVFSGLVITYIYKILIAYYTFQILIGNYR